MAVDENVFEGFKGLLEKESGSDTERVLKVAFGNSQSLDAFGRLRISQSFDLFDNKNILSRNSENFDEVTSGSGAIAYSYQTASVSLTCTQTSGDRALRQTRYLTYIPGKSQKITMTGVLAENSTDDLYCVVRTSTSGSVADTKTIRTSWDDTLLGTGLNNPSGQTIDFTKAGIFSIEFQWLGVGRVVFSVSDPNNKTLVVNTVENSFQLDDVYMRTGSLPMRYEIVSDGSYIYRRIGYFDDNDGVFFESRTPVAAGTFTLKEICCSCNTEGGVKPIALQYHANTRGNMATATTGGVNVLAVKLADSFNGNANRKTGNLLATGYFADDQNTIFEVYKVTSWTDTGSTWTAVNSDSACEYAAGSNISITITTEHMIACSVVAANSQGSRTDSGQVSASAPFDLLDENRVMRQNYDSTQSQLFLVKAYTMAATTTVGASITWSEVE